ncbi:hypothetical protein MTR_6g011790 [Medicago truncatula]|uniref:Uncharacterized protein n=1 Tax=Medicago truncatula TaxID=3880 RepID=A0A072UGS8_MEDTR|nr:hypothetical protein MTR_6g011790 [Medicago truncatula]
MSRYNIQSRDGNSTQAHWTPAKHTRNGRVNTRTYGYGGGLGAGNGREYGHLDAHMAWGRAVKLLPMKVWVRVRAFFTNAVVVDYDLHTKDETRKVMTRILKIHIIK